MSDQTHIYYLHALGQRYLLQEGRNPMGRDRTICKIFLPERYCGRIHATITIIQDQCRLEITARHPVSLNGREIRIIADEAIVLIDLSNGDIITIFEHVFQLIKQEQTGTDLDDTE